MKCPHCGGETPVERPACVACGKSLQVTADSVFAAPSEDAERTEWGPKLLRYLVGLVVLACVLGFGASYLKSYPLAKTEIEEAALTAPEPTLPMPSPPKRLPKAPIIKPESVALTGTVPRVMMAFGSRDPRLRKLFLERNGGDEETERAVKLGLKWLGSIQAEDGSWDYKKFGVDQKYRDVVTSYKVGISGLALLAFLGAGHTHQDPGPYKEVVAKALHYLLSQQSAKGLFPGVLYQHGICTMAIAEAYGLTGDTTLEPAVRRAVEAIVAAQQESGGWDYGHSRVRNRSDTSVTGWQVMALKSARKVGIEFPKEVYRKVTDFLTNISRASGIGYQTLSERPWRTTPALTAAGLNALLFAGVERDDPTVQRAIGILLARLPTKMPQQKDGKWNPRADIYFWYHGSLALSRLRGPEWKLWNERIKTILVRLQDKEGQWPGSWPPHGDSWSSRAGRVYFTSLAILALEVYYRYD